MKTEFGLKLAKELVYDKSDFEFSNLHLNTESSEYSACTFNLNGKNILYRKSKITPKKVGQFVTIWKRNKDGITTPFDVSDAIDFIVIISRSGDKLGQFVFPKKVLADRGIISQKGKTGKRGIRVYPPWDVPESKQAEKTQNWQVCYFLTIATESTTDFDFARNLLSRE